ncbi:uncharacterized [Tachysurus ichikawai]
MQGNGHNLSQVRGGRDKHNEAMWQKLHPQPSKGWKLHSQPSGVEAVLHYKRVALCPKSSNGSAGGGKWLQSRQTPPP